MEPEPAPIDGNARRALQNRLEAAGEGLWETELMRVAWPGLHAAELSALGLFRHHFALFAALYELADEYLVQGRYLFVHVARTRLLDFPAPGACRGFDPALARFCAGPLPCPRHPPQVLPEPADARGFYRDPANIAWLDEENAERVLRGAWRLLSDWPRAEAAWVRLGLAPGSGFDQVRKRYRHLARRHHPDLARGADGSGEAGAEFRALQEAYALLGTLLNGREGA